MKSGNENVAQVGERIHKLAKQRFEALCRHVTIDAVHDLILFTIF